MIIKNNKKGAVEMSLNLIIMLVIGLTILGLIISFVTGFLGQASDSFDSKLNEDDKTKIKQALGENGNFAFLTSSISIEKGDSATGKLYIKVRNPTADPQPTIFTGGPLTETSGLNVKIIKATDASVATGISVQGPPIGLAAGQEEGYPLIVDVADTVAVGNYFATFGITIGTETYSGQVSIEIK